MADGFDIIDLVFAATKNADTGIIGYKDRSPEGETRDHYTVRTTGVESKIYVNKVPVVNVNVFIKILDSKSQMMNRQKMKEVCRKLYQSLEDIPHPAGMYWRSRIVWTEPMGEAKAGFDCINIRLEVITELN